MVTSKKLGAGRASSLMLKKLLERSVNGQGKNMILNKIGRWLFGGSLLSIFGLLLLGSSHTSMAAEQEEAIEEVVVTGTYLKRSAADSPSPLSVMTSADIEDIGAADVAEVIASMPWNSGSQTRAATFQGEGADGRNTINLRNLGNASTLPLVNGRRHVPSWYNGRGNASTNINALVPTIAIERIEVVKDGASALYGSDAVAGVVNFITKNDFEGFDVSYQFTTDEQTNQGDTGLISAIWGVQGDKGGIIAAMQMMDRNEINVADDYQRYGGSTLSSTGQPGRLLPIGGQTVTWAANGLYPGQQVGLNEETTLNNLPRAADGSSYGQADVNCEDAAAFTRGNGGALANFANRCVYDYGSFFSIQAAEEFKNFFVNGNYELTSDLNATFEFASNSSVFDRLNSLNPNAPALTIPTGTKYIDADGNVQVAPNPGSVEDAFRRGIEPVEYANLTRLQGYTADQNGQFMRPVRTFTKANRSDQRMAVGLEWSTEFMGRDWTVDFDYTSSSHTSQTSQVQDTLSTHMELALNGYGGPECDLINGTPGSGNSAYASSGGDFGAGNCYFFNPFGSSVFDRDGNVSQANLELANPTELYEWLVGRASSDTEYKQSVLDLVASGDLFDTNSGPVGLAVGFQRRLDRGQSIVDSSLTSDNLDFVFGADDWQGTLTTTAFFAEVGIPLGDMIDVNIAARYEEFDEIDEDTVDPKISLIFRPTDDISVRASAGSSFRTPSLLQSFGSLTTVANQADLVGGSTFKPSVTQGNPELGPESADNFNVGITWEPKDGLLDGLYVDLDYYNYEYEDIITRQNGAAMLALDNAAIQGYVDANAGTTLAQAALLADRNYDQVIRNSSGILLRLLPNFANADSAEVDGIDLNAYYRFENDYGNWRVGAQAAWTKTYDVQVGDTTFDAVGSYNFTTPVARPLPEFKVNGTVSWSMGDHRVFFIARWIDEVDEDIAAGTAGFFQAVTALAGNQSTADEMADGLIDDMLTMDIQYNYNLGPISFINDANVTLGIQNLADEAAPVVSYVTAYDPTLHDGRGRLFFVRIGASM